MLMAFVVIGDCLGTIQSWLHSLTLIKYGKEHWPELVCIEIKIKIKIKIKNENENEKIIRNFIGNGDIVRQL